MHYFIAKTLDTNDLLNYLIYDTLMYCKPELKDICLDIILYLHDNFDIHDLDISYWMDYPNRPFMPDELGDNTGLLHIYHGNIQLEVDFYPKDQRTHPEINGAIGSLDYTFVDGNRVYEVSDYQFLEFCSIYSNTTLKDIYKYLDIYIQSCKDNPKL